jgi:D-alanyl-D-alanine dipeptidase
MRREGALRCAGAARRLARIVAALCAVVASQASARDGLPADFVYLHDIDASIAQDIRYAGANNFVGRPLSGYDAAECVLRREVALALKRVQADLRGAGLGLKVYDCYRPERAVRAMAQWAHDGRPDGESKRFFPRAEKRALFALGYIASSSRHSAGIAVDLTLIETGRAHAPPFNPAARYGPCTGPAAQRAPDDSLDMGTGYDCLDVNSRTSSPAVGGEQQRKRALLVAAMTRQGFRNYFREWWHFSYAVAGPHYDFPIPPRARNAQAN